MIRIEKISSFDAPELRPYATMRRPVEHEVQGIFVAEGEKVVRRLLESHFTVVSAVFWERWLDDFRPLLEARPENITVYLAEKEWLETLTGFTMFQGVLAVGKIPAPISLGTVLLEAPAPRLFAAVDGLTSSENLGALVRNCAAFSVHGLIVGETSTSPFLRRAVRNSMGAIFQLPIVELGKAGLKAAPGKTLPETLRTLRERGICCVAAHPRGNKSLYQVDFSRDCCLVFGSEGEGISKAVLDVCNEAVSLPMPDKVDSLNVGAAAAVFLYEVSRQRRRLR
ncbi:MAG TPA: RNA methyltransferase [Verrucomicrobiae bacterium]|jgi:tRNA G18 (ribose-2'-O)-methylase SpoU|nr:RNA methyltransferase [Verrucomicrobiae bacterium]